MESRHVSTYFIDEYELDILLNLFRLHIDLPNENLLYYTLVYYSIL